MAERRDSRRRLIAGKAMLVAFAAAGMAAVFGTPLAALLLAVELLLFEYRPRSLIPVTLASCTATAVRFALHGVAPAFPMPELAEPLFDVPLPWRGRERA